MEYNEITLQESDRRVILQAFHITKYFRMRNKNSLLSWVGGESRENMKKLLWKRALEGVSFSLYKGEILALIGESGSGKSTLAKLLARLDHPSAGWTELEGEPVPVVYRRDRLAFRRRVQLIFQNPFDTFDPRLNIAAILLDTLRLHQIGANDDERLHQCIDHMKRYGFNPAHEYIYRYPHELSGGQLQRISILRSMLLQPQVLLADEPFSMLDASIRADMMRMLVNLVRSQQMSTIFISHDIRAARWLADRVGVMSQGRIVEIGSVKEVLETPKHPYTQALLSAAGLG